MRSDIQNWTTVQLKKSQVERLKKMKQHQAQPLWEVVEMLIQSYGKASRKRR